MRKKIINWILLGGSLATLGIVALVAVSCTKTTNNPPTLKTHGANFTYTVASTGAGKTITFTNTSANAATAFWSFGDDSTSTEFSPTHAYADEGTYVVSLVSGAAAGAAPGESIKTIHLVVSYLPCSPIPAGNLIKGGSFEKSDSAFWTCTPTPTQEKYNIVSFGSTENPACPGSGGFHIENVNGKSNGGLLFQSLGVVDVGNYTFSGDINFVHATPPDTTKAAAAIAAKSYYLEVFFLDKEPYKDSTLTATPNTKSSAGPNVLSGFNSWIGSKPIPSGVYSFPVQAYSHELPTTLVSNSRGQFAITVKKEYWVAIQYGSYSTTNGWGVGGVTLDNFAIFPTPK